MLDGAVELTVADDADLDRVRDVVAELGLPLYRLGSRLVSLDDVFLAGGATVVTATGAAGAVYDRGYRPYDGPRGRRGAARRAVPRVDAPGARAAAVVAPEGRAVHVARDRDGACGDQRRHRLPHPQPAGQPRSTFITYRDYVGVSSALLVFVALVAPDIICPDRRQHVLPLLFARPITGVDYVVAKLGAIVTILFAFSFLPQVVLFVGQAFVSDSVLDYVRDNLDILWKVPISVALLALFYAVLGIAVSSLATRRIVAGASFIGLFLVSSITSDVLVGDYRESATGSAAALINVLRLPLHLRDLVFLGEIDQVHRSRAWTNAGLYREPIAALRRGGGGGHAGAPAPLPVDRAMSAITLTDPAFVPDASVEVADASVWFGQKVALSELSCSFGAGVTGLLGPNGAGKTTLMRAIIGLLPLNQGTVRVGGLDPRRDRAVHARMALVPEDEAVPGGLTARQLVRYVADLHALTDRSAPDRALAEVGMLDVADRRVDGFSKGMRQRAKVAAALVCDPHVLVLDEPLNGADPVQRLHLIDLFQQLGAEGRTVIVSSHVLNEVERLADRIIVVVHGRLAAAGGQRAIRDAMNDRPRHVLVRADDIRRLAALLVGLEVVAGVRVDGDAIVVSTSRAAELASELPRVARDAHVRLPRGAPARRLARGRPLPRNLVR